EAILISNRALPISNLTTDELAQVSGTPTSTDADTIAFNIPGSGVHTINVGSALPTITESVTIDGYTQPGAVKNTLADGFNGVLQIELNGVALHNVDGITISAGGSTVRGLVINRFQSDGTSFTGSAIGI